jgi:ATP-binding cassette, subfamily B, bacterial
MTAVFLFPKQPIGGKMQAVTKETAKIFLRHSMRYKWQSTLLVSTVFVAAGISVYTPQLMMGLFDTLNANGSPDAALRIVLAIFVLDFLGQVVYRVMGYAVNFVQPRVMSDLLNTCYEYLLEHSYGFFSNTFQGSIVTRVRRFHSSYERVTDTWLFELGPVIIRITMILYVMFTVHLAIGVTALVWVALYAFLMYRFTMYKLPYDMKLAEQDTKVTAHLADTITNIVNLKLFTGERREVERFRDITQQLYKFRKRCWDLSNHANVVQGFSMVLLNLGVMSLGVWLWGRGQVTVGALVMLVMYMGQIFDRMWDIGRSMKNLYEGFADANEMTLMLMQKHEIVDMPGATELVVKKGEIEFRNVCFHYHTDVPVLKNFCLKVRAGEKVGLVGHSGSGKSTLVKLLFRFKNIQSGQILVDGQDISRVTQSSLRRAVTLVPQDAILFHRSLTENISYGRPEVEERAVEDAAEAAHAHRFINSFPDRYRTYVGERGMKLSGGERQRVAIARSIVRDSPILVMDEATSSLDSISESYIQDALRTLMEGRTTIVIAHRLSTVRDMDRIIVLQDCNIIEEGTHEELMAADGRYRELWDVQRDGFSVKEEAVV